MLPRNQAALAWEGEELCVLSQGKPPPIKSMREQCCGYETGYYSHAALCPWVSKHGRRSEVHKIAVLFGVCARAYRETPVGLEKLTGARWVVQTKQNKLPGRGTWWYVVKSPSACCHTPSHAFAIFFHAPSREAGWMILASTTTRLVHKVVVARLSPFWIGKCRTSTYRIAAL